VADSQPSPRRLGRRPALDGFRGLAVLLVMATHTGLLANGYIGVDIFFALSGFLITTMLWEEWGRTGEISFRRFYGRRARRLLPGLLLLVSAFALVAILLGDPFEDGWSLTRRVTTTLLFANNWVTALGHQKALGPLAPTWSLAQEEQFYLLWPLALWVLLRLRVKPWFVVGLLVLMVFTLLQAVPHVRHALPAYSDYFSPLDRTAELLFGCIAAVVWQTRWVPRPLEWRVTAWALSVGIAFLLFNPGMPRRWVYLGTALLSAPLILNMLAERGTLLERLLSTRALRYTGTISYGLYLCHLFIHHLLTHYVPGRSPYFYAPLAIGVSFVVAAASWHLVEVRILTSRRRLRETTDTRAGVAV
jgi:peptidoglycan/LPS O-acetylase OafA/YrhL